MTAKPLQRALGLVQTDPALSVLRLAVQYASPDALLDDETLDIMYERVEDGVLSGLAPAAVWQELARGLMMPMPSRMFGALYASDALSVVLPEVAALFGVPQIADEPPQVDIGQHTLRVLDEAALSDAPLAVRFAALVMNVGKADSPPEHLPVHYRHVDRGTPRIQALCERLGVPQECRDLALLAIAECERVHRVTEMRAGPVALMLERLGAFTQPSRFAQFMTLCACDYGAYPGRITQDYPKAKLLRTALRACEGISAVDAEALREARAMAIAAALRSERWADR